LRNFHLRDGLAALSLANLGLIGVWNALLNYGPAQGFFLAQAPPRAQYAAAMANVFLLGLLFFVLIRIARALHRRYGAPASAPILLLMTLPAIIALVRLGATELPWLGRNGSIGLVALVFCAIALSARQKIFAVAASILVGLAPLIPIEAVLSISRCRIDRTAEYANGSLAVRAPQASRPRIVWIIFDELDYRLSFPDRPADLAMPEFDRLRAESVFEENATSPANDTLSSVSSLLTGTRLASISTLDPSHATAHGVPLTSRPTIFSTVHNMGGNAAVVGWYLPYCRLFSQDLAACEWHEIDNPLGETSGTFADSVLLQEQSLFEYGHASIFRQALRARYRTRMLREMTEEARCYVADPSLDFVFLHLPAPHAPHFYDRVSRTFTKRNTGAGSYPDSLALADMWLGDIRTTMTRAGLWDKTTVLVSSDHPDRASKDFDGKSDGRVPFLLKLAGQTMGVTDTAPLRTVVSRSLLEAVFKNQIATREDAVRWLHAPSL
jgi:hypothetical protein